jgi:hypothetical protein
MSTISHNSETLRYLCLWRFRVLFSVETRWLLLWRSPPANRRTSCSCGSRCRSTTWAGTLRKTICSRAHSANCGRARTRNLQRWVNIGVRTDTAAAAAAAAGPSFLLLISCSCCVTDHYHFFFCYITSQEIEAEAIASLAEELNARFSTPQSSSL